MARHETRQVMEGGAVVIPKEMRDELGIGDGDNVEFEQREGEVLLRRGAASPGRDTSRASDAGVAPNKVQAALKGMNYPAQKNDLVAQAKKNGADAAVHKVIERFPDQEYGGPQDVMKAFSGVDNRA